jgi:hypothetical protein
MYNYGLTSARPAAGVCEDACWRASRAQERGSSSGNVIFLITLKFEHGHIHCFGLTVNVTEAVPQPGGRVIRAGSAPTPPRLPESPVIAVMRTWPKTV